MMSSSDTLDESKSESITNETDSSQSKESNEGMAANAGQPAEEAEQNQIWLKLGDITLKDFDRKVLESPTEWLTDNIINAAQHLLKTQYVQIEGLQDVLLNPIEQLEAIDEDKSFVQIVNDDGDHWLVLSNCRTDRKGDTCAIYDSRLLANHCNSNEEFSEDVRKAIFRLMNVQQITVEIMNVSQQPDTNQCGLYAIAFAEALCAGKDPSDILFSESPQLLRSHLKTCLENANITQFPNGSQTIFDSYEF